MVHLRMAVRHLPTDVGAKIYIQSAVIDILPKFEMAATYEGSLVMVRSLPPVKICHDRLSSFVTHLRRSAGNAHISSLPHF